jgi:2-C-methyl-D-erythritol 4-phosphate cytidylyltransferase
MGAEVPKQFLPVCGKEILVHTLEKFLSALESIGAAIGAGAATLNTATAAKTAKQPETGALEDKSRGDCINNSAEIVVVLPAGHIPVWNEITAKHSLTDTHRGCAGGRNRFMSVYNGLETLGECDIIAIHDGVRPLLSQELILRCLTLAESEGTAIPVLEPVDSFRMLTGNPCQIMPVAGIAASETGTESGNHKTGVAAEGLTADSAEQTILPINDSTWPDSTVDNGKLCGKTEITAEPVGTTSGCLRQIDRSLLRAVQTPQVFRADIIREAYGKALSDTIPPPADPPMRFTDDASVAEYSGVRLSFCEGERRNIKITHPEDILFAETLLLQNMHNR